MTMATISARGWVLIPADMRRRHALRPGGRVCIVDYGDVIAIVPVMSDPVADTAGILRAGSSLTTALVAERRAEREREN